MFHAWLYSLVRTCVPIQIRRFKKKKPILQMLGGQYFPRFHSTDHNLWIKGTKAEILIWCLITCHRMNGNPGKQGLHWSLPGTIQKGERKLQEFYLEEFLIFPPWRTGLGQITFPQSEKPVSYSFNPTFLRESVKEMPLPIYHQPQRLLLP